MRLRLGASGAEKLCALSAMGRLCRPLNFTVRPQPWCLSLSDASHSRLWWRTMGSVSPTTGSKVAATRFKHP